MDFSGSRFGDRSYSPLIIGFRRWLYPTYKFSPPHFALTRAYCMLYTLS